MNAKVLLAVVSLCAAAACAKPAAEQKPIVVGAPADIARSGLPQQLLKKFEGESHVRGGFVAADDVGLERGSQNGTIDVLVVNSTRVLTDVRRMKLVQLENVFAYDDYILAGPRHDPAHAHEAKSAADAFRRIVSRHERFCSPADVGGLQQREAEIWAIAKIDPRSDRHYRQCKGTAADALTLADHLGEYTITDRATFTNLGRSIHLVSLLEGTPMLHNDYSVVLITPPAKNENAVWFVQWLMSDRGREAVESYRFEGGRRFFLAEKK